MRLLTVGDVCGLAGCEYVRKKLSLFKKENKIDVTVVNGENSAEGNGVTPESADFLFACGADVVTGGNHSMRRREVYEYLDSAPFILRPHNLSDAEYGKGYCLADFGSYSVAVINLSGTVYLERLNTSNPFLAADELVEKAKKDGAKIIVVDFHAEATSEKRAMGLYLDGKVSAVFGTHTHVQTADEQVLPGGTGYITDIGMTGPKSSVLGVKSDIIINRFRNGDQSKFVFADGECMLCGCVFDIDPHSGKTLNVERVLI